MEELNPDSLSDAAARDPAMLAAFQQAKDLEDRDVFDVNGQRLGRVTRAFAEEGSLARLDVTLSENARGAFDATQDVVGVPPQWVGRVTEDGIHLRKAAQEVVHPEGEVRAGDAKVGAKDLPRKVR